jgi:hypothetical protein
MWKKVNRFVADIGPLTLVVTETPENRWMIDAEFHGIDPSLLPQTQFSTAEQAQRAAADWAESVLAQRCVQL